MMLAWILMLAPPAAQDLSTADLRRLAEDHARAERFTLAGETYLQLARRPDVRPRDELYNAHTHFENAFLIGSGAEHLCRALRIAERVLADGVFDDDQEPIFWREVADFDLSQLADDARRSGRPNCRFDAAGHPRPPVLLLTDADLPPPPPSTPAPPTPQPPPALPATHPSGRGLLITGGVLLGTAAALGGGATAAFVRRDALVDQERALAANAAALGYADTATLNAQAALGDGIRAAHRLMLGTAITSGITAGTAAVLLAIGAHRRRSRIDVQPTLGGLLIHGRF